MKCALRLMLLFWILVGTGLLAAPNPREGAALGAVELGEKLGKKGINSSDEKVASTKRGKSLEITRTYRPTSDRPFGLITHTYWGSDISDAKRMFKAYHANTVEVGSLLTSFEAKPKILTLGEEREVYVISAKGKSLGTYLQLRQDRLVLSLLIKGIYFDDQEVLEAFVTPWLSKALSAAGLPKPKTLASKTPSPSPTASKKP